MLLIKKYKGIRKENILNLFENLNDRINKTLEKTKKEKSIKPSNIYEDELNLAKKLDAIEEYTIERFEENIVVLENRENQKMINVGRDKIPEGVKEGDIVTQETVIGYMGSTGMSTGSHLHFEIKINGETVDPDQILEFK